MKIGNSMRTLGILSLLCLCSLASFSQRVIPSDEKVDLLMEQESFQEALVLLNEILNSDNLDEERKFNSLYKRAVCYYTLEQFEDALSDLDIFVTRFPRVSQAQLLRTLIYGELGESELQLKSLDELISLDPLNPRLLKWQGSLMMEVGKYDESRKKLLLARSLGNDAEVELYLGLTYYYQDDSDSALFQFDKAIGLDKSYMPAYLYAGSLCIQEEAYSLALEYLEKALKQVPNDPDVLFYKGVALVEMKNKAEGCSVLRRALREGNDDAAGYLEQYCYQ